MASTQREHHHEPIHEVAQLLDMVILNAHGFDEGGAKASWLAEVCGMKSTCLSNYRTGERPIPAYLVPILDRAMGGHQLLSGLAKKEGCGIFELAPSGSTASLETLQELIQRTHGHADAELTRALRDGHLDDSERASINAMASKMRRFWQDIEERTGVGL